MYLVKKSAQVHILRRDIYDAGRCVQNKPLSCLRCVATNMSKKEMYYIIPKRRKTAYKPCDQPYATDVKNLLFMARLAFLRKTGCVTLFSVQRARILIFFLQNLSLEFLNIRFLTFVAYCSTTCTILKKKG